MNKYFAAALAALLIAGCSSTPISSTPSGPAAAVEERAPGSAEPVRVPPVAPVATGGLPDATSGAQTSAVRDLRGVPTDRSIYFDYDSFAIKDQFKPVVEAHARFLVANPRAKILVQGNTDERGSREYNVALGQKRADVVKKAMMLMGVREDQVESVSLGEEKPRNAGRDEAAWAENRRSDVLYSGEF
jgi:peptidoglycan-associated lipoprotein